MEDDKEQKVTAEQPDQPFESDTEKLVHRHLANPNDVITDEDLAHVRVGQIPPPDKPTEEAIKDGENRISDHKADKEDDTTPGAQKITPWDLIGP